MYLPNHKPTQDKTLYSTWSCNRVRYNISSIGNTPAHGLSERWTHCLVEGLILRLADLKEAQV